MYRTENIMDHAKSLADLRLIWETDKETFKYKELGGLQQFVAEVLQCKELFNLHRGYESTEDKKRSYEFVLEKNKKGHRADIVIFYKSDEIVIPVEVEKCGHITDGIHQLVTYQKDYQKSYGILTDGYYWRFYNNNIYKQFTIEDFFSQPTMLQTFWAEYTNGEKYYLNFFQPRGQLTFSFIEQTLNVEENKDIFFEDITKLISKFKDKLNLVGYLQEKGTVESDKKATEISYAYFIQFILYKSLVDNCYGQFNEEFAVRLNNIYKALKVKLYQTISVEIFSISDFISVKLYKPFSKEQEFINSKLQEIIRKPNVMLEEITLWLDIIVFIKKYNFSNIKNEIFGYIYENYLKELYENKNKGQYFTDPSIVNFMLDEMGYTPQLIRKKYEQKQLNTLSLIDPSCGSGTFLYSAVNRIIDALFDGTKTRAKDIEQLINNNIFGLDIAEFPLYLAEMNILMRMLPVIINENYTNPVDKKIKVFKTQDSITEFMDAGILANVNKIIDERTGQMELPFDANVLDLSYKSYIRDEDDLKEMKQSMCPPRKRFDFVVGNPPYIGYNECCKQKILFTQIKDLSINNIYGVNLHSVPGRHKPYSPKPNLYAFFIALGGGLLKPQGKMCYIIPQTVLTANDLDVVRYYLAKETTIEKIITFSGNLFIGRGLKGRNRIATSSLIFILHKTEATLNNQVKVVSYHKTNESEIEKVLNSKGNNRTIRYIAQSELLSRIDNWNFLANPEELDCMRKKYDELSDSLAVYYLHTKAKERFSSMFYFDKGLVFDKKKISTAPNGDYYLVEKKPSCFKIGLRSEMIDQKDIRLPEGSQGIKVFSNSYKIIWQYMNAKQFYYSDQKIMIDYNWVVISSDNKQEMLFLLSILNSPLTKTILDFYLKIPNEQDFLLGIKSIKQFVRVPKITDSNRYIKEEIIKQTQIMLDLENYKLSDFIDFSILSMQKFDKYKLKEDILVLTQNNRSYQLKINNKMKVHCIQNALYEKYNNSSKDITLNDLKLLPILDKAEQTKVKNYIDDLVFALYFNISVPVGLNQADTIRHICSDHSYYNLQFH